jgi:hypothetical protein
VADHPPDLELDPCAAVAVHRWDHPEGRAAAWQVDRARAARVDRAEGPASALEDSDFGPQEYSLSLG